MSGILACSKQVVSRCSCWLRSSSWAVLRSARRLRLALGFGSDDALTRLHFSKADDNIPVLRHPSNLCPQRQAYHTRHHQDTDRTMMGRMKFSILICQVALVVGDQRLAAISAFDERVPDMS